MEATDLLKKVRTIEIKTRRLSKHIFAGEYHSAFKGKGISFSEVREYQFGDDIRNIDWKVTARFNHPYIKVFEEERELTVMLLIDVSGSREFGTQHQLKKNLITEISAVLSFSAIQNNDKIGVMLFSNTVEKYIPPQKGKQHILRIIRELIDFKPIQQETNISVALQHLTNVIKKRCTAFIISDFMDIDINNNPKYDEALKIANKKHDIIALKIYDQREAELPTIGLIQLKDAESGELRWIDSSNKKVQENYKKWWYLFNNNTQKLLLKNGIDNVQLKTDEDYIKPLLNLFKRR